MLVRSAVVIMALFVSSSGFAQEWKYITSSDAGSVIMVDSASIKDLPPIPIRRDFAVRQVWIKSDASQDLAVDYHESVALMLMDCATDRSLIIKRIDYDHNGKVVQNRSSQDYDFNYEYIAPDTVGASILKNVCGSSDVSQSPPAWRSHADSVLPEN